MTFSPLSKNNHGYIDKMQILRKDDEIVKDELIKELHEYKNSFSEFKNSIFLKISSMEIQMENFSKNVLKHTDELESYYKEKEKKENSSKVSKSASKSDSSKSINNNQVSILNLGFLKNKQSENIKTFTSSGSNKSDISEKSNTPNKSDKNKKNSQVINLEIEPIPEVENEETMTIPIVIEDINKNSNVEINTLAEKINVSIDKIDLEEKQINYNQKFFDYKILHKEKETENLKRKSDNIDNNNQHKRAKKNEWIRKESNNENAQNINNINTITDGFIKERIKNINEHDIINIQDSPEKNIEMEMEMEMSSKNVDNFNRGIYGYSKLNNSNDIQKDTINETIKQPNTKFENFIKLKSEKNISVRINKNKIEPDVITYTNKNPDENKNYDLDLHTLEESYNEFYQIKPIVKKNPFIPDIKKREYKGTTTHNNKLTYIPISNVRNKKEREKMNGYKCEICENFYEVLGEKGDLICQTCSRHRTDEDPNRTPKGFYEIGI